VDVSERAGWWTRRRIAVAAAASLLAVLAAAALTFDSRARSYAPLEISATGSSDRGRVQPLGISSALNGHFLVHPGTREFEYGLVNNGRWAIVVDGFDAVPATPGEFSVERVVLNKTSPHERVLPRKGWRIRIPPHGGGASVSITYRLRCVDQPRGSFSLPALALRAHYRYLHFFERSQDIPYYDAMTLAC
jgi:hypothetical protein